MSMRSAALAAALAACAAFASCAALAPAIEPPLAPQLGKPLTPEQAARFDLDVFPDGRGLPPGRGTAAQGRALYGEHCAGCHGRNARGATAEELAGASAPLAGDDPDKTVGSYWPYATTLFDFIRRAKPMTAPGRFSDDEVYALVAHLLALNGLLGEADALDAATLPKLRMPNRDGFVGVDAPAGPAPAPTMAR